MIEIALAAGWTEKLAELLAGLSGTRKQKIAEIGDELLIKPEELAPLFIEPDIQPTNPIDSDNAFEDLYRVPLNKQISHFLQSASDISDGRHQMFILGDAGMGKTSVLAMLKLAHVNAFFSRKYNCVAIKLGSETIIKIKKIENKSKTLLLLDALDEDKEAIGRIRERVLELLKETQSFYRVIFTCRTQFFPKTQELTFIRQDRIRIGGFTCPVNYLSLFSDMQVREYLVKKYGEDSKKIKQATKVIESMGELKCRPMLLAYIDDLVDHKDLNSPYKIYEALVSAWLDRECRKPDSKLVREDLLELCQAIARSMSKVAVRTLSREELNAISLKPRLLNGLKMVDVGGRSLLNLNSDGEYLFAHQSFQEFLVVQTLKNGEKWGFPSSSEMMDIFFRSESFANIDLTDAAFNNSNLSGAHFTSAILCSATFNDCDLSKGSYIGCDFQRSSISSSNIHSANLQDCVFERSQIAMTFIQSTSIDSANFYASELDQVIFVESVLYAPYFSHSKLSDCELTDSNLTSATFDHSKITGLVINRTNIVNGDFSYGLLGSSNVQRCDLHSCNFQRSKVSRTLFHDSNLCDSIFENSELYDLEFIECSLINVVLDDSTIDEIHIQSSAMKNARSIEATIKGSGFSDSDITHSDFSGSKISDSRFTDILMNNSKCSMVELSKVNISNIELNNSTLKGARMNQVSILDSEATNSDWSRVIVDGSEFSDSDFSGSNFRNCYIKNSNFRDCDFRTANLEGARFEGVNFSAVNFSGVKNWKNIRSLSNSNLSNIQNPPEGFIPWAISKGAKIEK